MSKIFKHAVAATLLAALSACGGSGEAAEPAAEPAATPTAVDPTVFTAEEEAAFLAALAAHPFAASGLFQNDVDFGRSVCGALDRGADPEDAVRQLVPYYAYNPSAAYLLVLTEHLCPQHYTATSLALS